MLQQIVCRVPLLYASLLFCYIGLIRCSEYVYTIIPSSNTSCSVQQSCHTLDEFALNATVTWLQNTDDNLTMNLLCGNHSLSLQVNISNIASLKLVSENGNNWINCRRLSGFNFKNISKIQIVNLKFYRCGVNKFNLKTSIISLQLSSIAIKACAFIHSSGTIIEAHKSSIVINQCIFNYSYVAVKDGYYNSSFINGGISYTRNSVLSTGPGVVVNISKSTANFTACMFHGNIATSSTVIQVKNSNITMHKCEISNNTATSTDVVFLTSNTTANFTACMFHGNSVTGGKVIRVDESDITMHKCELTNNTGKVCNLFDSYEDTTYATNGEKWFGVVCSRNSTVKIHGCHFKYNCVIKFGVLQIESSRYLNISNTTIEDNDANTFKVLNVQDSLVNTEGLVIRRNHGIVAAFIKCTANITEKFTYSDNLGTLLIRLSEITFHGRIDFLRNNESWSTDYGGALTSSLSIIHFMGTTTFSENWSNVVGGAIWSSGSKLHAHCRIVITNNIAVKRGGGIFLHQSELDCHNCTITGNHASDRGGGIHASSSIISVGSEWKESEWTGAKNSTLVFASNNANTGGGLSLEANSKLYAFGESDYWYDIVFKNNTAELGIAIFVDDDTTNIATCNSTFNSTYSVENECFLQTPFFIKLSKAQWGGTVNFSESESLSNVLFGGLLDRCTVYFKNDIYIRNENYDYFDHKDRDRVDGVTYLKKVSHNEDITALISSEAVRVCFCRHCNGSTEPACDYTPPPLTVIRGKTFHLKLAAVDQVNRLVDTTIYASLNSTKSELKAGLGKEIRTNGSCITQGFNIISPNDTVTEELSFYAKGPCKGVGISKSKIEINFENCSSITCPIGFQPLENPKHCKCQCDPRISLYVTKCYKSNQTLLREHNFWIDYVNETNNTGFLFHQDCPNDYCLPASPAVYINLNIPNGADAQCNYNRSGLLCGSCKSGFSLSLGSSHCVQCNSYWPGVFIAVSIGALLSGIGLVAFVLLINLTVAVGTLNGLIFYANIVFAGANSFLPFRNQNFFTIFIAWLNLSVGLDTCFIKGLDAYAKVWLELAFPIYIIVVLGIMILATKCSSRFTQFIGKGNPVATLATLIFLSYAKLLSIIIDILSLAVLKYPNGSRVIVWHPDATVKYLQGKHVLLFLTATVIVTMGLAYTCLLYTSPSPRDATLSRMPSSA